MSHKNETIKSNDEWVVPTDEDARHRPMVQVIFLGEWYDAQLLAVTEYDKDGRFVVEGCFNWGEGVALYGSCRMKASERNQHDG
jgi:hypothetical protein